jgi:8-oxo-dGTP pyrophosphatase MutT (NUDIX family)
VGFPDPQQRVTDPKGILALVSREAHPVPSWLRELADVASVMDVPTPLMPPSMGGRRSAVLVLFGEGPDGPDLLLIERGKGLRLHAGQTAFPGGAIDVTDEGPVAAALREAAEEVGVDPGDVDVLAALPELYIPPTGFLVVPVLAWWRRPRAVAPMDSSEVDAVARISMRELADPAGRLMLHRPTGIVLPAFRVRGRLIWGMTAAVVDRLLTLAGWERPWDSRVVDWH